MGICAIRVGCDFIGIDMGGREGRLGCVILKTFCDTGEKLVTRVGEGGGGERFGCAGGEVCSGAAVMEEERFTVCIHSWQISGYCGEQRKRYE